MQKLFDKILDKYMNSKRHNGYPIDHNNSENKAKIIALFNEEKIDVFSDEFFINPHIRPFNVPRNIQLKALDNANSQIVLYPSKKYLTSLNIVSREPFSDMMKAGATDFDMLYFDCEILDLYFKNPKYYIHFSDYRGNIYLNDNYYDPSDDEFIKYFGIAYHKDAKRNRAVAVFISDLAQNSSKIQMKWFPYLCKNQDEYCVNHDFVKNVIHGDWTDNISIYWALLEEMKAINLICEAIKIPKLFNKEFDFDGNRPEDLRMIFLPTLKNYHDFLLELEKVLISNINWKTFCTASTYIQRIEDKDSEGKKKSTLNMLDEWLTLNIKGNNSINDIIIKPLRSLRRERQAPAHEILKDEYNKDYYIKQDECIDKIYSAIRVMRLLFAKHPLASAVKINPILDKSSNIIIY